MFYCKNKNSYSFITAAQYVDRVTTPRGYPDVDRNPPKPANEISQVLFQTEQQNRNLRSTSLSILFMTFGQFIDHDLVETPHASASSDCPNTL